MKYTAPIFAILLIFLFVKCKKEIAPIQIIESDPPSYHELCLQAPNTIFEFTGIVADETNFEQKYTVTLTFPSCYQLTNFIDLDAKYGNLVVPELDINLQFGMGQPVGTHLLDISTTKTEEIINGRVFWYEERNEKLYFSFPAAGPASFVSSNIEFKEELLTYLRTLKFRGQ